MGVFYLNGTGCYKGMELAALSRLPKIWRAAGCGSSKVVSDIAKSTRRGTADLRFSDGHSRWICDR